MDSNDLTQLFDVILIGSGPQSLAVAARLLEGGSDSFSESQRTIELGDRVNNRTLQNLSILSVDPSGKWMGQWNDNFTKLGIEFLRSPMSFHIDPSDPQALLSLVSKRGEKKDILSTMELFIQKKKRCKNKPSHRCNFNYTNHQEFDRPSSRLFSEFCEVVVRDYQLDDKVLKDAVTDIVPIFKGDQADVQNVKEYQLKTKNGITLRTKRVVVAIGLPKLQIPKFVNTIPSKSYPEDRLIHVLNNSQKLDTSNMRSQTVVIVGSGLTSVHLAMLAIKAGASKVHLVSRKKLCVKYFDFDLEWVGRFRGKNMSDFFAESNFQKRLQMIKKGRGGGSVTPEMMQKLKTSIEDEKVIMHECMEVSNASWKDNHWEVTLLNNESLSCDKIWMATGYVRDIQHESLFSSLRDHFPIEDTEGFPHLTEELRWKKGLDVFLTGAYGGLQIGPDAFNLAGARRSSSRIVEAMNLNEGKKQEEAIVEKKLSYVTNSNIYSLLPSSE